MVSTCPDTSPQGTGTGDIMRIPHLIALASLMAIGGCDKEIGLTNQNGNNDSLMLYNNDFYRYATMRQQSPGKGWN